MFEKFIEKKTKGYKSRWHVYTRAKVKCFYKYVRNKSECHSCIGAC